MKKLLTLAMCVVIMCGAVGLTACSGKTEYAVTCNDCENGYVIVADSTVKAGEKVILAAHPSVGYRLTAFILDGEVLDGCSFVMPEKDVAVSATFEPVTYSVTYVLGDAEITQTNPDTYTVESAGELYEPHKDGYEICGWYRYYTETEYGFDMEYYRVTSLDGLFGNLTLYARYYNPPHQISIVDGDDGWVYLENYGYEAYCGETFNITVDPYTGYELDYITVNGERIDGTSFTMPACDVEIAAYFKLIRYEITYLLDGGVNSPNNPEFYTVEDGYIQFEEAYKDGYIFCGWYLDDEYNEWVNGFDSYNQSPITLYAYFIPNDWE